MDGWSNEEMSKQNDGDIYFRQKGFPSAARNVSDLRLCQHKYW